MFKVGDKLVCIENNIVYGHKIGDLTTVQDVDETGCWIDGSNCNTVYASVGGLLDKYVLKQDNMHSPGPYPQTVKSELVAFYDCDDTLVMWNPKVTDVSIQDSAGDLQNLARHEDHVRLLKDHKARGYTNIVWSAGGYQWAQAVVKALELEAYVDLIMAKPVKFFDDLPAQEVLTNRVYLPFKE